MMNTIDFENQFNAPCYAPLPVVMVRGEGVYLYDEQGKRYLDMLSSYSAFTPGFKLIPYGDSEALAAAITKNTAAFLVEPIQGEGGIIVPPTGYLKACEQICRKNNVLLICDEIQTGLGRTGKFLASFHEDV